MSVTEAAYDWYRRFGARAIIPGMSHLCPSIAAKMSRLVSAQRVFREALTALEGGDLTRRDDVRRAGLELSDAQFDINRSMYAHWYGRQLDRMEMKRDYHVVPERRIEPWGDILTCFHALDDGRVVIGSAGGHIYIAPSVNVTEGRPSASFPRSRSSLGVVEQVQVMHGGNIAALHRGGTVYVYEVSPEGVPEVISQLGLGESVFQALPDGRIVTGGIDGFLRIWERLEDSSYDLVDSWKAHSSRISGLSVQPDGGIVATDDNGTMMIWKLDEEGYMYVSLEGKAFNVRQIVVVPDGRILVAKAHAVDVWIPRGDEYDQQCIEMLGSVSGMQWLPDNRLMVTSHAEFGDPTRMDIFEWDEGRYERQERTLFDGTIWQTQITANGTLYVLNRQAHIDVMEGV